MKVKRYKYTEGYENIAPGVTAGTDFKMFNNDGVLIAHGGIVKPKGRFNEIQTNGDKDSRNGKIPMKGKGGKNVLYIDDLNYADKKRQRKNK